MQSLVESNPIKGRPVGRNFEHTREICRASSTWPLLHFRSIWIGLTLLTSAQLALAKVRVPIDRNWSAAEVVMALVGVALAAWALGIPARWIGRRMHEKGLRDGSHWKVVNGQALYSNSFIATLLALGGCVGLVSWLKNGLNLPSQPIDSLSTSQVVCVAVAVAL